MPTHHSATLSAAARAAQSLIRPAITSKACEGSSGYTGTNTMPDIISDASVGNERPAGASTTAMLLVAWLASRPCRQRPTIRASGSSTTTGKSQCVLCNECRPGCRSTTRSPLANRSPDEARRASRSRSNVLSLLESIASSGAEGRCLRRRKNVAAGSCGKPANHAVDQGIKVGLEPRTGSREQTVGAGPRDSEEAENFEQLLQVPAPALKRIGGLYPTHPTEHLPVAYPQDRATKRGRGLEGAETVHGNVCR